MQVLLNHINKIYIFLISILLLSTKVLATGIIIDKEISPNWSSVKQIDIKNKTKKHEIKDTKVDQDFYLIGPGDILQITLFDAPELSGEYQVLNDGSLSF